jgi:hypothetical protein
MAGRHAVISAAIPAAKKRRISESRYRTIWYVKAAVESNAAPKIMGLNHVLDLTSIN